MDTTRQHAAPERLRLAVDLFRTLDEDSQMELRLLLRWLVARRSQQLNRSPDEQLDVVCRELPEV